MALRFNPPPGWPVPPEGLVPPPGWQPDPSWPPAPPGWQFWVLDDEPSSPTTAEYGMPSASALAGDAPSATATAYRPLHASAAADYEVLPGSPPADYEVLPAVAASDELADPWSRDYGVPGPGWAAPPPPADTSRWAIAALVLGVLGLFVISAILAIVFGVHALGRIRDTLERGRGMAIAGIALGSAWLVLGVAGIVAASTLGSGTPAHQSGSPSPSGQRVNPFSMVAGDCFDNPPGATSVTSVLQTSCAAPHNAEIFATFDVGGSIVSYPGSAKLSSIATTGCNARAKAALNSATITRSMTIRLLFPLESSWISGQRTISCMIYSPTSKMRFSVLKH